MTEDAAAAIPPKSSPRDALERAAEALRVLENSQVKEHDAGLVARLAVWAVILLASAGLVVHTFFEEKRPQVDSTSVALLAVALIAPFVSRLKALEVGGAKAEWQEGAAVSLKEIIDLLGKQQAAIEQLFDEVTARAASGPDAPTDSSRTPQTERPEQPVRPLQHLLWVDDHPENNAYELDSLRRLLRVTTTRTNDEAFRLLEGQEIDAVISDVGRDYDEPGQPPGGVRFIQELRGRYPERRLPVLYYTSRGSVQRYGKQLEEAGAAALATLFSELLQGLRQVEDATLGTIARTVAGERGAIHAGGSADLDVVVDLPNGRRVGIEVGSWLQRPQMAAFTDRVGRLTQAIAAGQISQGILLARPEVLDGRRRDWATDHRVEVVAPSELPAALDRLSALADTSG